MQLSVDLPEQSYPVFIEPGGIEGLGRAIVDVLGPVDRVVIVSDSTVWPLVGEVCEASLTAAGVSSAQCIIGCGEAEKSIATWSRVLEEVLDLGVDRSTPIVAVGGGLVGDLAGFVAATAMRGLPFIQVPTTLLAMVDSAVGGKTGVNTRHGKNMVGAFYQPQLVFAAMSLLGTLDEDEFYSGLGEVVKHALLADAELFALCEQDAAAIRARQPDILTEVVAACVRIKASVVVQDERESGWRAVLNLGHTVGHAIEATLIGTPRAIPHGLCVAIGLIAETAWAERLGACPAGTTARLEALITALGLPQCPTGLDAAAVLAQVKFDKKVRRGKLQTAVVEGVGRVRLAEIDGTEVEGLFHSLPGF
jgi:3-dehydroquinate synthase